MVKMFKPTRPSKHRLAEAGMESIRYQQHTYPDVDTPEIAEYERQYMALEAHYGGPNGEFLTFGHPERKGFHDDFPFADLLRAHALQFPIPADSLDYRPRKADGERKPKPKGGLGRGSKTTWKRMMRREMERMAYGGLR